MNNPLSWQHRLRALLYVFNGEIMLLYWRYPDIHRNIKALIYWSYREKELCRTLKVLGTVVMFIYLDATDDSLFSQLFTMYLHIYIYIYIICMYVRIYKNMIQIHDCKWLTKSLIVYVKTVQWRILICKFFSIFPISIIFCIYAPDNVCGTDWPSNWNIWWMKRFWIRRGSKMKNSKGLKKTINCREL